MPRFKSVSVSLDLPFIGGIEGTWEPDERERNAAWEMYVELVTRISVVELGPAEGLLREALSSLYSLFGTTREILRKYGPTVAQPKGNGELSFGYLAVAILNTCIRPVLATWHPQLLEYDATPAEMISQVEHERQWDQDDELRAALDSTRRVLIDYAELLAQVSGVPSLIVQLDRR